MYCSIAHLIFVNPPTYSNNQDKINKLYLKFLVDLVENSNPPLVSVLITCYNREKYIGQAIESVLVSTFTNFELLIVDDYSNDKSVEIARSYEKKDHRVKVYVNTQNIGQFRNRNLAATYAKGKYIKYLDSDDLIYSHGLQVLVQMMEENPEAGYGLCSLDQDRDKIFPFLLSPQEAYYRHFRKNIPLFHKAPLSSIVKRNEFFLVGGFTNLEGEGDYELWLALSQKFNVLLIPQGIVWYRTHTDQIDFNRRNDGSIQLRYFLVTLRYLQSENCPLDNSNKKKIIDDTHILMVKHMVRFYLRLHFQKLSRCLKHLNFLELISQSISLSL